MHEVLILIIDKHKTLWLEAWTRARIYFSLPSQLKGSSRAQVERMSFCVCRYWLACDKKIAASCHSVLVFVLQRMVIKQQENIWLTAAKHKIYRRFSCRALISRSGKCSFQIKANPRWCTILVTSGDEHLKNSTLLCVNAFRLKTSSNTIINLWPIIDRVISQWLISHNA